MTRALSGLVAILLVSILLLGWQLRGAWRDEATAQEALRASQARARAEAVEVVRLQREIARRDEIAVLLATWRAELRTELENTHARIADAITTADPEYLHARAVPVPGAVVDSLRALAGDRAPNRAAAP